MVSFTTKLSGVQSSAHTGGVCVCAKNDGDRMPSVYRCRNIESAETDADAIGCPRDYDVTCRRDQPVETVLHNQGLLREAR